MKNVLLLFIASSLIIFSSCSKKNNQTSTSSQTSSAELSSIQTEAELTEKLGKPDEIQSSTIANSAVIKKYGTNTFQIENGKVTAAFRNPIGEEVKLQYWFHYWKDETPIRTKSTNGIEVIKTKKSKEEIAFDTKLNKVIRIIRVNKL